MSKKDDESRETGTEKKKSFSHVLEKTQCYQTDGKGFRAQERQVGKFRSLKTQQLSYPLIDSEIESNQSFLTLLQVSERLSMKVIITPSMTDFCLATNGSRREKDGGPQIADLPFNVFWNERGYT